MQVSWHFRGPLQLKQFAFYFPDSEARELNVRQTLMQRRHGHQHLRARDKELEEVQENHIVAEKRAIGDTVIATINGQVLSWKNEYAGPGTAPTSAATAGFPEDRVAPSAARIVPPPAHPSAKPQSRNWVRKAYYNATSDIADGLIFLNHHGGQGSGVFDESVAPCPSISRSAS